MIADRGVNPLPRSRRTRDGTGWRDRPSPPPRLDDFGIERRQRRRATGERMAGFETRDAEPAPGKKRCLPVRSRSRGPKEAQLRHLEQPVIQQGVSGRPSGTGLPHDQRHKSMPVFVVHRAPTAPSQRRRLAMCVRLIPVTTSSPSSAQFVAAVHMEVQVLESTCAPGW